MDEAHPVGTAIVTSDHGVSVSITDADGIAGRFNREMARSGSLGKLKEAELKILSAMCSEIKAHNLTKLGEPFVVISHGEIMEATGLGPASVQRGPKALEAIGLLTIHARGLGPRKSIYILHFATLATRQKNDATELACQQLRGTDPITGMGSLFESDKGRSDTPGGDQGARTDGIKARACAPLSPTDGWDQGARLQGVMSSRRAPSSPTGGEDPTGARLQGIRPDGIMARACAPLSHPDGGDQNSDTLYRFTSTTTAAVEPAAATLAAQEECRELLRAEQFDDDGIARLVAHPNCTVEQVRIAILKADSDGPRYLAKKGNFNRRGYIVRAIEGKWAAPRKPGQRRAARPESDGIEAAKVALEKKELDRYRADLRALDADQLRRRVEHMIQVEHQEFMRTRWTQLLACTADQLPPTMLKALHSGQPLTRPLPLPNPETCLSGQSWPGAAPSTEKP